MNVPDGLNPPLQDRAAPPASTASAVQETNLKPEVIILRLQE
jgi:hypothetical protein